MSTQSTAKSANEGARATAAHTVPENAELAQNANPATLPSPSEPSGEGATKPSSGGDASDKLDTKSTARPTEIGGYDGPEPTRFGDWEHNGRCTDF